MNPTSRCGRRRHHRPHRRDITRTRIWVVSGCLAALTLVAPLSAAASMLTPNGNPTANATLKVGARSVTLDPAPAVYVESCPWLVDALSAQGFDADGADDNVNTAGDNWTVTYKTLEGTITLQTYRPWIGTEPATTVGSFSFPAIPNANHGGADIGLTYQPAGADPSGAGVRWIQVVRTNAPLAHGVNYGYDAGGGYRHYLDDGWTGQSAPPTDPFYGADDNNNSTGYAGNSTAFVDTPARGFNPGVDWEAQVFIATGNLAARTLTIYDGVWWGFETAPEPGTFVLVAIGGILLGVVRAGTWRKRRSPG